MIFLEQRDNSILEEIVEMIKVFYTKKQSVDQGDQGFRGIIKSPSANKPYYVYEALQSFSGIEFIEPNPLLKSDFELCHEKQYVENIFSLQEDNGFGNRSKEVAESLYYTNGAMYDAIKSATPNCPSCALVAGFHHAGYRRWRGLGYFCTFNGLMVAAMKLAKQGRSVAIIDCDMHWGNGTDNILKHIDEKILHISFGKFFICPKDSEQYLKWLEPNGHVEQKLIEHKIDAIIYQAGADVHINDPYGGIFTTEQIFERDKMMFSIAKKHQIPIAWDLAGGYQVEEDGSIQSVLDIHINTFKACKEIY